eukprot:GHVU01217005.1.p1 GENE.GHVU01217005.1~~GHVU01217005.1.p1  ORF type:complete len:230 (-),score=32.43 GHVU01217005.1:527-1216(-)
MLYVHSGLDWLRASVRRRTATTNYLKYRLSLGLLSSIFRGSNFQHWDQGLEQWNRLSSTVKQLKKQRVAAVALASECAANRVSLNVAHPCDCTLESCSDSEEGDVEEGIDGGACKVEPGVPVGTARPLEDVELNCGLGVVVKKEYDADLREIIDGDLSLLEEPTGSRGRTESYRRDMAALKKRAESKPRQLVGMNLDFKFNLTVGVEEKTWHSGKIDSFDAASGMTSVR